MDTPFQEYIGTNYVPSIEEATRIRDLVNSSANELQDIDVEIDKLQEQMNLLQEKRSKIHGFKEQHEALISPARKLTRDIVESIFLACLPEDENPKMDVKAAPMLLTRICSSWRGIALSTPRLWAAICIVIPTIELEHEPVANAVSLQYELVQRTLNKRQLAVHEWLDRSGASPLSISVFTTPQDMIPSREYAEFNNVIPQCRQLQLDFFRDVFLPYHRRWYDLDILITNQMLKTLLEAASKGELHPLMLKKVEIELPYQPYNRPSKTYTVKDICSIVPMQPTSITLRNISIDSSEINSVPIDFWVKVTDLDLSLFHESGVMASLYNAIAIIRRCPSLITLTLTTVTCRFEDDQLQRTDSDEENLVSDCINLKHLRILNLEIPPTDCAVSFARAVVLPSIKELNFQFSDIGSATTEMAEEIFKSLLRVTENFQTLRLSSPDYIRSTNGLLQMLKATPTIKQLMIHSNHMSCQNWSPESSFREPIHTRLQDLLNDDLLEALLAADKDFPDIICPRLEVFKCNYHLLTGFTESGLKKFINDRRIAHLKDDRVADIRQLHLFVNYYKEKDEIGEKISMGRDSTIYFRIPETDALAYEKRWPPLASEAFNEL